MNNSRIKVTENESANAYLNVEFILPPRYASNPPTKGVIRIVISEMFMGCPL
jgi:hypothetical protein